MSNSELIRDLVAVVGEPNVVHRPEDLIVFEYDGSVDRALPTVVALPRTTAEVSDVVKAAADPRRSCRGAGSGDGPERRGDCGARRHRHGAHTNDEHLGDRRGQPTGRRGAGGRQHRPFDGGKQVRPVLRAGPFEPEGVHHRRERRGKFWRATLPGIRCHD